MLYALSQSFLRVLPVPCLPRRHHPSAPGTQSALAAAPWTSRRACLSSSRSEAPGAPLAASRPSLGASAATAAAASLATHPPASPACWVPRMGGGQPTRQPPTACCSRAAPVLPTRRVRDAHAYRRACAATTPAGTEPSRLPALRSACAGTARWLLAESVIAASCFITGLLTLLFTTLYLGHLVSVGRRHWATLRGGRPTGPLMPLPPHNRCPSGPPHRPRSPARWWGCCCPPAAPRGGWAAAAGRARRPICSW